MEYAMEEGYPSYFYPTTLPEYRGNDKNGKKNRIKVDLVICGDFF